MRGYAVWLGAFAMLLWHGPVRAQGLAGTWQGSFQTSTGVHRAVLQIVQRDRGGWVASAFAVEFFAEAVHIDSLVVSGSDVRLAFNGGKGAYEGKMSADGGSIAGTWSYEKQPARLELRHVTKDAAWSIPFPYQYHFKDISYARPSPDEARIAFTPRLAVDYMEQGAVAWTGERGCVACHTNGSYVVVRPLMISELGPPKKELRNFLVSTLKEEMAVKPGDMKPEEDSTQAVYVAAGLAIWDAYVTHRLSAETAQALGVMFRLQRSDGDWTISDDNNPPLESSRYQLATVAARAVGNAPGWEMEQRGTPVEAQVNRLREYLRAEGKMQGDYDRTDLLWAATEFPGLLDAARKQELVEMIFSHQRADGGWAMRGFALPEEWGKGNRAAKLRAEPELGDPPSDGHMTGLAIIALRKAGVAASDVRIQRGVAWLLTNQRASGRWWTRSLNRDGWQFISYSGTVYPLLALTLCGALPAEN